MSSGSHVYNSHIFAVIGQAAGFAIGKSILNEPGRKVAITLVAKALAMELKSHPTAKTN